VVDPDMLHQGDDSTVNALFQAHSFEDRVLKLDHIHVGRGASLAQGSVVFYGAHIGDSVQLAPHAVVMKNEHLAAGQRYARHPCEPEAPVTSAGATRPR
jgi:acetyltransferase-like isoleucine patch superfamily enzyme